MTLAAPQDACREFAREVGRENPELAWICTPYDTWEPNPYYTGPAKPHPEQDEPYDTDGDTSKWNENGEGSERDNDAHARRANPEEQDGSYFDETAEMHKADLMRRVPSRDMGPRREDDDIPF